MEDERIVELLWNRNEAGIEQVSCKYHSLCYKIAWNLLTNREDSEECVNDTWFATWKYIPPQKPSKLGAFVGRITRGFAIDKLRKKYAFKRAEGHISCILEEVKELNYIVVRSLDEHIEAQELIDIINNFLNELSDKDRDIFVSRYWKMDSINKIANRHNMTDNAVKQNLFRTKTKLKKILEREGRL